MVDRRILIIRTGGLGDSLMLWPGLAAVRRRLGSARIDLLGNQERLAPLVAPAGADRAVSVEGSGLHQLVAFQAEPDERVRRWFGAYDTVVAFAAEGDYALGENLAACGIQEVHVFLPFPPERQVQHAADYILTCLQAADLADPEQGPVPLLPVSEAGFRRAARHLAACGLDPDGLALLVPGSGSARKAWPAERFATLAAALADRGLVPALVSGPADAEAAAEVLAACPDPIPVLADEDPSLLAGLLAAAELVVGNDSGPSHLAGLVGARTVAVFGPSDPVRWRPLGARVEVVRAESGDLDRVSVDQVLAACRGLLDPLTGHDLHR